MTEIVPIPAESGPAEAVDFTPEMGQLHMTDAALLRPPSTPNRRAAVLFRHHLRARGHESAYAVPPPAAEAACNDVCAAHGPWTAHVRIAIYDAVRLAKRAQHVGNVLYSLPIARGIVRPSAAFRANSGRESPAPSKSTGGFLLPVVIPPVRGQAPD